MLGARAQRRVTFRDVFALREFRFLWFAELFSIFGDQLARVALSVLVFDETDSAALTGLTYALTYLPSILGGVLLGGLADRFPRRDLMMVVDLIRAALIASVALSMPFWALCVLVGLVSFLNPLFKSAQLSLLPAVLDGDRFTVGMAIRNITNQSAQLAGFAGGGLLMTRFDPHTALVLDAVTFVLSALFVRFGVRARPAATSGKDRLPFLRSMGQGGRLIFADPGLRVLLLFTWLAGFLPVYEGLAAPYADVSGGGSLAVGLVLAADPAGSAIGAFVYMRWVPAAVRPRLPGVLSVLAAVPLLACLVTSNLVVSLVVFAISGALGTTALMQATVSYTLAVPDDRRGQAMGLSSTGLTTVLGLSPLAGGVVAEWLGPVHTVAAFGIAGLLLAVPLSLSWQRTYRSNPERWTP